MFAINTEIWVFSFFHGGQFTFAIVMLIASQYLKGFAHAIEYDISKCDFWICIV